MKFVSASIPLIRRHAGTMHKAANVGRALKKKLNPVDPTKKFPTV